MDKLLDIAVDNLIQYHNLTVYWICVFILLTVWMLSDRELLITSTIVVLLSLTLFIPQSVVFGGTLVGLFSIVVQFNRMCGRSFYGLVRTYQD